MSAYLAGLQVVLGGREPSEEPDLIIDLGEAGTVSLLRNRRLARFDTVGLLDEELVHPYLAPVVGIFSVWGGRQAFHGGAVVIDGRAWALLADRHHGKSSLLGCLSLDGHSVVSDDVLVVEGNILYAGLRCIDLREDVAERLGAGRRLEGQRRDRWRLDLGPVAAEVPLAGWIFLSWGDRMEITPVSASQRLHGLIEHHLGLPVSAQRPEALLDLARLQAWELRRPLHLDSLDQAAERLVGVIS